MKIRTSKADIIWSYLGYFFSYGTNLLIVLLVMRKLETELLGLWYTFLSIGSLVQILDFGISSTLIRNVTYAWSGVSQIEKEGFSHYASDTSEPNYKLLGEILFASKNICLLIAVIAVIIMAAVGTPYLFFVAREIQIMEFLPAWILFVIATFLNIYYIFWPDSLTGIGAIKEAQVATIISRVIQITVSIIVAHIGSGLLGLASAYLIMGIVLRGISKRFLYKYNDIEEHLKKSNIKNSFQQTKSIFLTIWYNAKKAGIVSLTTFMLNQTSTLVCSAYIGLAETASYGLCMQLLNALAAVSYIWFKAETPMLVSLKVENNIKEIKKHLSLCIFMYLILFISGTLVISTLGFFFLNIINYSTELPLDMFLFFSIVTLLEYNHSLFCSYIAMSNSLPYVKASACAGVAVAVLTILCGKFIGSIYSLIFVKFIVQLAYNNWKWPSMVLKELKMTPLEFLALGCSEFRRRILSRIMRKKQ